MRTRNRSQIKHIFNMISVDMQFLNSNREKRKKSRSNCLKKKYTLSEKKSRHKISSVKKIVGKTFRHWENNSSLFTDDFFCLAI